MTQAKEDKSQIIKEAYILSKELGDGIVRFLMDLPYKYKPTIEKILQGINQSPRGDIKVDQTIQK